MVLYHRPTGTRTKSLLDVSLLALVASCIQCPPPLPWPQGLTCACATTLASAPSPPFGRIRACATVPADGAMPYPYGEGEGEPEGERRERCEEEEFGRLPPGPLQRRPEPEAAPGDHRVLRRPLRRDCRDPRGYEGEGGGPALREPEGGDAVEVQLRHGEDVPREGDREPEEAARQRHRREGRRSTSTWRRCPSRRRSGT